jgi:hypothetical protein
MLLMAVGTLAGNGSISAAETEESSEDLTTYREIMPITREKRGGIPRNGCGFCRREKEASDGTGLSVPEAVRRGVGNRQARRAGQLRTHGGNHLPVARLGTPFRARDLFCGVNQQRQPQALAACRSPLPELLIHRLSFWSVAEGNPGNRRVVPIS